MKIAVMTEVALLPIAVFGLGEWMLKLIKINMKFCGDIANGVFELVVVVGCFYIFKIEPEKQKVVLFSINTFA